MPSFLKTGALCALLFLPACGIKPKELSPPAVPAATVTEQKAEQTSTATKKAPAVHPATYPDIRTDPPPPPVSVDQNLPPL